MHGRLLSATAARGALAALLFAAVLPAASAQASPAEPELGFKSACRAGGPLPGRAATRADTDWDLLHADLSLAPDFATHSLAGSVRLEALALTDGLASVRLDFADPMSVLAARQDGAPVAFAHADDAILITLSDPLPAATPFALEIDFAGEPVSTGFGSFVWDSHAGVDLLWTVSEPRGARDWWPCKDVPDEKFTADVRYRVPVAFSAPGPGLLQSVTEHGDGTRTWHWRTDYPINSYLIALTVTRYDHYTDWFESPRGYTLPIENYVYPENLANSTEDLSTTPAALALLDSLFGAYPFRDEKYGHAAVEFGGGMEHQTITSIGNDLLDGEHGHDRLVVHELAHQWFGNSVTLRDWRNVWLNEGFARYCDCLWVEHTEGYGGLVDLLDALTPADHYDGPVYNHPVGFHPTVYNKGAWVLHMLRHLLGDETFFAALNDYYARHAYGNADTADLQADLEAFTGLDLGTFFSQWVYGENRPVYEWGWAAAGAPDDRRVVIQLRQVQTDAGLFETRVPMHLITTAGVQVLDLANDQWLQQYTVELGAEEPMLLLFDPDRWLLANDGQVPLDPTAVSGPPLYAESLDGIQPNPFNPATRIHFTLAEPARARLAVHDVRGRLLRVLADGPRSAGPQSLPFDGLDSRGRPLPSGVYLARLTTPSGASTLRMTLLR